MDRITENTEELNEALNLTDEIIETHLEEFAAAMEKLEPITNLPHKCTMAAFYSARYNTQVQLLAILLFGKSTIETLGDKIHVAALTNLFIDNNKVDELISVGVVLGYTEMVAMFATDTDASLID